MSFWLALPAITAVVAATAAIFAFPTLRMRGAYFVLATFAFGEVVRLSLNRFRDPFGGPIGFFNIPSANGISLPLIGTLSFDTISDQYYLVLVALGILTLIYYRLVHSNLGMAMRATRDSHNLAASVGIDVFRYEMTTFALAGAGAALAGGFYAAYAHYLEPSIFGAQKSIQIQTYVIVGGAATAVGPIIGTLFLTYVAERASDYSIAAPMVYGISLVVTMFFLRSGLITLPQVLLRWSREIYSRGSALAHSLRSTYVRRFGNSRIE
jgi:branched-chain amino acid transport system permease protein